MKTDLAAAVRAAAKEIAARNPGRHVELRIPPYAAVQIGVAETRGAHRRGNPPSYVEIPPEVFIELCSGTRNWAQVQDQITTSGIRTDLSRVFPLTGH